MRGRGLRLIFYIRDDHLLLSQPLAAAHLAATAAGTKDVTLFSHYIDSHGLSDLCSTLNCPRICDLSIDVQHRSDTYMHVFNFNARKICIFQQKNPPISLAGSFDLINWEKLSCSRSRLPDAVSYPSTHVVAPGFHAKGAWLRSR